MNDVRDVFDRLLADGRPPLPPADEMLATARRAADRRRGLVAAGGAALAVLAVAAVTAVGLPRPSASSGVLTPAAPGSPVTASTAPDLPRIVPVPLRFRPTWIPPGWAERGRMAWFGESMHVARGWTEGPVNVPAGELEGVRFELQPRQAREASDPAVVDGLANPGTAVDIGGKAGFLHSADGKAYLEWRADADTVLSIQHWGNGLTIQDLIRIARSVQPDPARLTVPFELGSLPAGMVTGAAEFVGNSPASWLVRVGVHEAPTQPPTPPVRKDLASRIVRSMGVALGTVTSAPDGGEQLTVAGHPARLVHTTAANGDIDVPCLMVNLGGGLLLTVDGMNVTRADLISTAERVTIDPTPDLSWIGMR